MTRVAADSSRRQLLLLGVVSAAILLVVLALATAGRPAAPGQVLGTDPGDGAALDRAPTVVRLALSDPVDAALSHVTVADAAGAVLNAGDVRAAGGDALVQPVTPAGRGVFTIAYHVTFADGREVVGSARFSVGTGVPPPADAQAPPDGHAHDVDPLSAVLLAADVAVLLGAVSLLLFVRPRRRTG